jgi:hypothetical protein
MELEISLPFSLNPPVDAILSYMNLVSHSHAVSNVKRETKQHSPYLNASDYNRSSILVKYQQKIKSSLNVLGFRSTSTVCVSTGCGWMRSSDVEESCRKIDKQSRTADRGWSFYLGIGPNVNVSS